MSVSLSLSPPSLSPSFSLSLSHRPPPLLLSPPPSPSLSLSPSLSPPPPSLSGLYSHHHNQDGGGADSRLRSVTDRRRLLSRGSDSWRSQEEKHTIRTRPTDNTAAVTSASQPRDCDEPAPVDDTGRAELCGPIWRSRTGGKCERMSRSRHGLGRGFGEQLPAGNSGSTRVEIPSVTRLHAGLYAG